MSTLFLFTLGVAVLMAAVYVVGRLLTQGGSSQTLAFWYRSRRRELSLEAQAQKLDDSELAVLNQELDLRLSEEVSDDVLVQADRELHSNWMAFFCLCITLAFASGLYWYTGAFQDIRLGEAMETVGPDQGEVEEFIAQVEQRVVQRPDNGHYWNILGRYYTSAGRYPAAVRAFDELLRLSPDNADILAQAAQAGFLAEDRKLSSHVQQLALRALELEPNQTTALGLLGMAFFEAGEYNFAIQFWQRLLSNSSASPESNTVIRQAIATARQRLAATDAGAVGAEPDVEVPQRHQVNVTVRLAEGLSADPQATVFVFAKSENFPMPVAARRFSVSELPLKVSLGDSDSMTPQARLSLVDEVVVTVRVSPQGGVGADAASHQASSTSIALGEESPPQVDLILVPVGSTPAA